MILRTQEINIKLIFELSLAQPSPILCNGKDKNCVEPRFNSVLISKVSLQGYGLACIVSCSSPEIHQRKNACKSYKWEHYTTFPTMQMLQQYCTCNYNESICDALIPRSGQGIEYRCEKLLTSELLCDQFSGFPAIICEHLLLIVDVVICK